MRTRNVALLVLPSLALLPMAFEGSAIAKKTVARSIAAPTAPAEKPMAPPDIRKWDLPNGLHVLFLAEHKAPVVAVQIFYHAGSKDEPADKRGIAHMFEHMMFKGSTHVPPEQHARFVDAVGGTENAFTAEDLTGYHETIPPSALEFTMKLEAERMRNLSLTQKTINSEREVVKEEHRLRLENNPVMKSFDQLLHLAYKIHPYRQMAVGEPAMLDRVTVEDCRKFYDEYYQPNNATLIIVGDTDEPTVKKLADQYFGVLPRGPEATHKKWDEPAQTELHETTMRMPVQVPVIIGGFHMPEGSHPDRYALEVLNEILSDGESARLTQRLVRKDKVAVGAGSFLFANEDPGLFLLFAAFLPSSDPAKVKASLADEIARMSSEKVSDHELTKAKNQLAARAVFEREQVDGIATAMGTDGIVAKDPLRQFSAPARYDAVTAADVQRVAKLYLVRTNYTEVTLLPPAKDSKDAGGAK